ncbi:(E2-independent) E3 ubiquitin-conjugating enzyme FATS isoform X3 [Saimiri boliviensis]|uniref:(E2-independent) E3 ubiquitin-conjugating enzyme FATS isoform X3 n=1 Tax=Saimiri boliviensis TaxID=27679 RepID=UPI00027F7603|nr:(E2-independent) E3 ubiquitin-conjugating enzyme FATS isoform X1 [Saimiri boliviensis boliviensis]
MQHSGIPTKTHQQGYAARYAETAVHRTFQIKTFSTELKNHVMVMDFVKSNWFPSQRRTKVSIIHMCQGLKTAEQTASRYEIHSRLFSSPKDHSAWERNESLLNAGLRDNYHSTSDQIALKNLQSDVTEAKSDFTKETLASQNTKMISSIVISQMIDENKSRENRAPLPLPCAMAQSHGHHTKQSLANRSGVNIHRAFAFLPGRLGIPAPSDERGPETELPPKEESPCVGQRRGFASITITARRVGTPASALVWGTVGDSLCPKCRAEDTLFQAPPALANGPHPGQHQRAFACTEFSRNSSEVRLKVPEAPIGLRERRKAWVTHADDKETSFSPDTPLSGKSPLVFSSCVHLRVSQQCPTSIYYVDKSLSIPFEQPQIASPKTHRSVLSLNLNCSSHRLTADGVDGIVNGEPISAAPKQELVEGDPDLLGQRWNPGLQESRLKEAPSLGRVHLGTGTCPWSDSFPLENTEFADVGTNQVTVRKGIKDHESHFHANQLSIHIPGWSYRAVHTKVFSGSSKRQPGEACLTLSAPPVEQKPTKHFLPFGDSSPSDDCLSRDLSEPTERRRQSFLKPRIPFPGFLCPLQDVCASPQEDNDIQIESKFPQGDYTCCDLVVKIKEYKKSEDPTTPEPSPAAPSPAPPEGAGSPGLSEDCSEPQQMPARSLTLQEALEVRKPQFISRSQERLKKLEHMVQQRKAQQKDHLRQKQSLLPVRTSKKQFTVPHPLSDNLFKPKERCISEKEMHMRSKRIYNNLPEVKKKKEEQRKRVILQSNRLRAEVFKKQLLDQLLQRNAV